MERPHLKEKLKRSVCLFFAAVMILTLVVSTGNAFADTSSDPQKRAKQIVYYHALNKCLRDGMAYNKLYATGILSSVQVPNSAASSGKLFAAPGVVAFLAGNQGVSKNVGAIVEKDITGEYGDGVINCGDNDNGLISKALNVLGISINDFICDYRDNRNQGVLKPTNTTVNCISALNSGTENFNFGDAGISYFKQVVQAKTGITNLDRLDELEAYYVYKDTFLTACATPNSTIDFDITGGSYPYTVMGFDETDKQFKQGGFSGVTPSTNVRIWGISDKNDGNSIISHDCGYIAGKLQGGDWFDAFKNYFDQEYNNGNGRTPESIGAITSKTIAGTGGDDPCYQGAGVLGWILCPIVSTASDLLNRTYATIEKDYLQIDAINIFNRRNDGTLITDEANANDPDNESTLHHVWGIFRDIANVGFVIFLLMVIFSQVTGYGIDNYGIKKMLPRIIVAALLVNLSYYICELVIDLSNIVGIGIKNFFDDLSIQVQINAVVGSNPDLVQNTVVLGSVIAISFAALLLSPGLILTLVAFLITMVVSVLFLWVILICRQAGIILAVAVAPLAFVCYILPNTEKAFKRWIDLMKGLLFLYPICSFVIGGGLLAGKIFASMNSDGSNAGLTLAAMIVPVLPYLFIPGMLRNSLKAMGNLGAHLQTIGSRWGHGLSGAARRGISNSTGFKQRQERLNRNRALRRARRIERHGGATTYASAALMRLRGGPNAAQRARLADAMKVNTEEQKRLRDINNWSDATYVERARNKNAVADNIARGETMMYDNAYSAAEQNKAASGRRIKRAETLQYNDADFVAHSEEQAESARIAKQQQLNNYAAPGFANRERLKNAAAAGAVLEENLQWDNARVGAENNVAREEAITRRENAMLGADAGYMGRLRRKNRSQTLAKQIENASWDADREAAEARKTTEDVQTQRENILLYNDDAVLAGERARNHSNTEQRRVESASWDTARGDARVEKARIDANAQRNNDLLYTDASFRARERRKNDVSNERQKIENASWTLGRVQGEIEKARIEADRAEMSARNYTDTDFAAGERQKSTIMNRHVLEETRNWAAGDFAASKIAQLQNARNAEIRKMYTEQFSSMDKNRLGDAASGELIQALRATTTGDPQRATERIDAAVSSLVNLGAEEEILESLHAFNAADLRSMNAVARQRLLQKMAASQSLALKGWGKAQLAALQSDPSGASLADFSTYMSAARTGTPGRNGSFADFLEANGDHALDASSKDLRKVIGKYALNAVNLNTLVNSSVSTKNGEELTHTNSMISRKIVDDASGRALAGIYTGQQLSNMDLSTFRAIQARATAVGADVKDWFAPAIHGLQNNQETASKVNNEIRTALGI